MLTSNLHPILHITFFILLASHLHFYFSQLYDGVVCSQLSIEPSHSVDA